MCQHADIIFGIKLFQEISIMNCCGKFVMENVVTFVVQCTVYTLSWYLGVNLCEGVLIFGYVERVHRMCQPNRIRNHEHRLHSQHGPQFLLCGTLFLDVQRKCQWRWGKEERI
jgi:hypothetical protein